MERIDLHPLSILVFYAKYFVGDSFEQNIAVRSFAGVLFQASSTCTHRRFLVPYGKFQAGNWTENNEKQVNNSRRTAVELLGHFLRNIRL